MRSSRRRIGARPPGARGRRENGSGGIKVELDKFFRKLVLAGAPLWYYKVHGSRFARAGALDWLISIQGKLLALETKREDVKAEPSPAQEREIVWLERTGNDTFVSNDLDEVKALVLQRLRAVGWEPSERSARLVG